MKKEQSLISLKAGVPINKDQECTIVNGMVYPVKIIDGKPMLQVDIDVLKQLNTNTI